jgi:hypothetical protein
MQALLAGNVDVQEVDLWGDPVGCRIGALATGARVSMQALLAGNVGVQEVDLWGVDGIRR